MELHRVGFWVWLVFVRIFLIIPAIAPTDCLATPLSTSLDNTAATPKVTRAQVRSIVGLLYQPAYDEFFSHVRDDVKWTVTGKSFLSGIWTTKASYRAATFGKTGTLVKPPGIRAKITPGEEGIIVGHHGWATVDLVSVDTYTNSGVLYDQAYAWHMRFDENGLIAEVKVWLDTETIEKVLGGEAALQNNTRST
ncbi:MAG: hypothetical protein Q9190_000110 [Brigantiaea leucoxantha]